MGRSDASGGAGEPEDEAETPEHAHLAVLPEDGSVWIAAGRRLVRLAADGTPLARRSLDRKADALALDPARGRLWVALHDHIEARAASDGSPFAQPALDAGAKARALAADPATGGAWVAGEHELARLGAQGEDLGRIELEEDAHAVAAYADTEPPVVRIEAPSEDARLAESRPGIVLELTDAGIGFDDASLRILLDGAPLAVACTFEPGRARCVPDAPIADGAHELRAEGRDFAGNDAEPAAVRFHVDTVPPAPPAPGLVAVVVAGGTATVSAPAGAVEPGAEVHVTNLRTGETVTVTAAADGSFEAELAAAPGDRFRVVVEDRAGNRSPRREVAPTVPDPARLAPPPPATGFMPFHEAVAFLYQGPDPVQRGVAPDAIDPRRVAVLRGRVTDREGRPLAGVRVSILGRPEFGHTLTRADGLFDLAVNGGGWLTVAYELEGRLPAHRKVRAPWRDYAWLPDVALIEPDPDVTVVTLDGASPLQVARGSLVRDADGERQATILFPAGTRAELVLPEGGTRPVTRLSVRLTEYTVGPNGPNAMPAELPPGTVYTYAVELSADEATAAGTDRIRFDRPVVLYVENYLGFPVGTPAPAGWYDRRAARWVPEADGRVIAVLDVAGGVAALDIDGDGQPDDGADLGITDEERRALAGLYAAGTELWRLAVRHFSAHDINWAGLDPRARPPTGPKPDVPEDPCTGPLENGSIVSCATQALLEAVDITGTPYRLLYRSDWVPGRMAAVTVPMLGADVPPGLTRVDLIVDVAGRRHTRSFAPAPDLSHTFVWDGVDAYGRPLSGAYRARIEVRYVFGTSYAMWASYGAVNARRFGTPWGTGTLRVLASRPAEHPLSIVWSTWLTVVGPGGRGAVGGWHLDVGHTLVPGLGLLVRGDGGIRKLGRRGDLAIPALAETVESGLVHMFPAGLAVMPDGSVLYAPPANESSPEFSRIYRRTPDGTRRHVAGDGGRGYGGDGGPAQLARFNYARGMAVGPDGSIYVADSFNHRVRRIRPDGTIETVAGTGVAGYSGDSGPATAARLNKPVDVAVAPDGSVFVSDSLNGRIRRIGPDGIIVTVAGDGSGTHSGDGGPAASAGLVDPAGIDLAPDGSLYVADYGGHRIRRIRPDGTIETVAGTGVAGYSGDGGPATAAELNKPMDVAVAPDGGYLIVADGQNGRLRILLPDGTIGTLATDPVATEFPYAVAIAPDGTIWYQDRRGLQRIAPLSLDPGAAEVRVPSEDGDELYVFDRHGRHLRTLSTLTGAELRRFERDADGRLLRIVEGDGRATRIERDASGRPVAIVSPDGHRTALATDADGWLTRVTGPAGGVWRFAYRAGGLLTRLTDPHGHISEMDYDARGRLILDRNARGGTIRLRRRPDYAGAVVEVDRLDGARAEHRIVDRSWGAWDRWIESRRPGSYWKVLRFRPWAEETEYHGYLERTEFGPDPRFGPLVRLRKGWTIQWRDSAWYGAVASSTAVRTRSAVLADPADPLSLQRLTDEWTIDGQVWRRTFDAATRTFEWLSPEGRRIIERVDALERPVERRVGSLAPLTFAYDASGRLTEVARDDGTTRRTWRWATGRTAGSRA